MTDAMTDLALGLQDGHRFRCAACGNLTRFDVVATERTRRFHHTDLGGRGQVESEEVLERTVESVTCTWCGRTDAIVAEPAATGSENPGPGGPGGATVDRPTERPQDG